MSTLANALRAASEGNQLSKVPSRLALIIKLLESDMTIHPLMRNDIITLIVSTTNLAEAVTDDSYPVDIVTDTVATLLTVSSAILAHVTHNRPAFYAYGIEDTRTKTLIDSVFGTKAEAEREITLLKNLGATSKLKSVPIRISSQIVNRPSLIEPPTVTITSDQYNEAPNDTTRGTQTETVPIYAEPSRSEETINEGSSASDSTSASTSSVSEQLQQATAGSPNTSVPEVKSDPAA